ncbi:MULTISPECIES: TetR/AcrR family transcriptional regulator [Streptomyces]|uniref:AcrR family transcriptional regulator n=2 Tax=Streptomyces TaxID=1883 RepID=A0ABT9L1R8_9ACTN|nr:MULTISPECIES: TetR family transcriptional regulator [Streptomyces]MBW8091117.1 WHG domain-containing protein [Streptomyces hygroscopicus subsp. hygroscopicus]MCO8305561.1 WHG domain-containing protein [Streptomyces sp. RKCA744]MDP9614554.1 AcrR family transcriptional regulator [Streptomyces demainii]GHJ32445.1 TetR family transcriptional regulator [Streptomyces hygroscopicus]GLV79527.1 TetR family transcriptional regulator [Streptomyces hygroscopicus subsp. hygroscopicus]
MSPGEAHVAPYSRRERLRIATIREIKDVARTLLVQEGPENVTIRAIAREMGMTAPAVYRYFSSRDALILQLRVDIFEEMARFMRGVLGQHPEEEPGRRWISGARALRVWAIKHPHEFGLILGPWAPGLGREETKPERHMSWVFGSVYSDLVADLWRVRGFPAPAVEELDPGLARTLTALSEDQDVDMPPGAIAVMLRCWVRLYGVISMEALGHMSFALSEGQHFFEFELRDLCRVLDISEFYEEVV